MQLLSIFVTKFLFVMAALLPIMNPPGLVPIFISMTARNTPQQRRYLARRIALYCALLLVGSMYVGGYVLSFFGVSLPVVQMSGGLLITFAAWRMLNDTPAEPSQAPAEQARADSQAELKQRAFYPLTFPLTVGPGSISVAITIGATLTGSGKGIVRYAVAPLAGSAAIVACSVLVYLCYSHADKLLRYLGQTGSVVFLRLSAFILLCLGVQIMWDGFGELAGQWLRDNAALLR
ncbi:MarC family protein [Chromobacterium sp. CV08]|uniref:MarC family protein n=1 Tax=Chromobacterium sp. CV08 TaxID=3133274 RepID=UPI003DA8A587